MDAEFAADVFEDRRATGLVGKRQVARGRMAARQHRRHEGEGLLRERVNGFGNGPIIVEHVLQPGTDREQRLAGRLVVTIVALGEIEHIASKPGVVDAVNRRDVVEAGDDRAVFRGPADGGLAHAAVALQASREGPQVRAGFRCPIHGAADEVAAASALVDDAGAGIRRGDDDSSRGKGDYGGERPAHYELLWLWDGC